MYFKFIPDIEMNCVVKFEFISGFYLYNVSIFDDNKNLSSENNYTSGFDYTFKANQTYYIEVGFASAYYTGEFKFIISKKM